MSGQNIYIYKVVRGAQYTCKARRVKHLVHRYIVVKIGGSKTRKLYENRGKFINFAEIGEYAICIIDL